MNIPVSAHIPRAAELGEAATILPHRRSGSTGHEVDRFAAVPNPSVQCNEIDRPRWRAG